MLYLGFNCLLTGILMLEILFFVGWVKFLVICRVLAKKEVSLLRSSLSHSPFFTKDLEQNFLSPVLSNALNFLATKLHVYKIVDAVHRKRTHYTVNTCSKQDFISSTLLAIVALILKVARNSFQTFHFITLDGLMWFRYQLTMCVT